MKKTTKRCAQLPSPEGYTKKDLRNLCIGKKPPNPVRN